MIYKYRMLSGEDKAFLRDYEIDSKSTFLDFHKLIQKNLGYDPDQLASFFLVDEQWNKGLEFTLIDMESDGGSATMPMESAKLGDIMKEKKERLIYVYDIFTDNSFFLELMDIAEAKNDTQYPVCSATVGEPPIQTSCDDLDYSDEDDESFMDEIYDEFNLGEEDFRSDSFDVEDDEK